MDKMLTFDEIKNNSEIQAYLELMDKASAMKGYKEHGVNHASYSAKIAGKILKELGYNEKEQELAKIAAYVHDIGNIIGEEYHDQSSAVMFLSILSEDRYNADIFTVAGAVGCHEDKTTDPASHIAAALVLGDKSDVCYERTQVKDALIDKHGRILTACRDVDVVAKKDTMTIALHLKIDTDIPVMDYFEIFMARMVRCRRASKVLECRFELHINGDKFL